MPLNPVIIKLLNDFADSQPALRIPGQPLQNSNPKLGDLLAADFAAVEETLKDLAALTEKLDTDSTDTGGDSDYAAEITDDNELTIPDSTPPAIA